MSQLSRTAQSAVEAVARHFSARWRNGDGPPDAELEFGGRRIALDVAVVAGLPPGAMHGERARLREDRVALRVLRDLDNALRPHVADGRTVILTLGAPIKVPNKLVEALAGRLLADLGSGVEEVEEEATILGNRVRFRVLSDGANWRAKVIGFVFSGDPQPGALASAMRTLRDEIAAQAKGPVAAKFSGDRWLVLASDRWMADIKTYRRAYAALLPPRHGFRKILMVFDRGRVETLVEG